MIRFLSMKLPHLILSLIFLASCKGQRFYWESRFTVAEASLVQKEALVKAFKLADTMSTLHPVFGKYCAALPSYRAHLFVCWKEKEIRVVSSYSGALKGDAFIRTNPATIGKYLAEITDQPGFNEHVDINEFIRRTYRVKKFDERMMTYGRGSLLIKDELSGEKSDY